MRKFIAFFMAALFLCALLTGCGAKSSDQPGPDPATNEGNEEPAGEKPDIAGGAAETFNASYTAFSGAKVALVNRILDSMSESESGGMAALELLGLPMMDLSLAPVAFIGMDETSLKIGLGILNAADIDYQVSGNNYALSYKDSEGITWKYEVQYEIGGKERSQCTLKKQEAEILYFEYMRTSFGYAAQYISSEEDGSKKMYLIAGDENCDGIVGISGNISQSVALSDNIAPDFPKQCESWFSVQGDKGEAVTADGTSITFTALPVE